MQTLRQYWGKQDIKLPKLDLTRVQRESYEWFLKEGIQEALNEINAGNGIEDFTRKNWKLEFGEFSLGNPKISPATARRKALTYDMPLRVMATLTNKQTGQQTRQEVFLGDIPKMTQTGTFIINGVERAVVNQLVRAPGIFYSADIDPNTGRSLYHAELRPLRGSWLELSVGRGDVITVKIDKHRKIAVTTLLRALGYASNDDIVGMFSDTDKNPDHQYIQATLAKDTTATTAEALLEIYEKMRPGEPAVLENATELLNELFFDPRRYDLGKVGRYKMNRRLKVNIPNEKENHVLTKDDIIAAIKYLIGLQNGQGKVDDIDHLSNRRVRRVGELVLTNAFRIGLLRLERAIREKMSLSKTDELLTPSSLVNARPLIATISEFFRRNRLSTILDQTNPLSEVDNLRRLSVMGSGGVTRERASFSMRDINASQYSRIDPVRSPEGQNIGLVTYMSLYSRVNDYGFLEAPYRQVIKEEKNGKVLMRVSDEIVYIAADEEEDYVITHAGIDIDAKGYISDEWVPFRTGNEFLEGSVERVQLIDIVPRQVVGTSASLIPFVSHDEAIRALMGTHMQCQAVPLLKPSSPVVGTGMEGSVAAAMGRVVYARHEGTVDFVDGNKVVVTLNDSEVTALKTEQLEENEYVHVEGKKEIYSIVKFYRTAQSTCYSQKPMVTVGQKVQRGDILIDGPSSQGGELALGQNLLIAYTSYEGLGYEDAIIISDRLVKQDLLTSIHINEYECQVMDTKLGPEELTADIPNVSDIERRNLTTDGIVAIGSEVSPNDILVGKIAPKGETELTAEERLLRAIFGEKAREVRDTSLRMPHGESGTVIDVKILDREKGDELDPGVNKVVTVKVAIIRKVTVGDKLAGRHGNKGVISKIVPQEDLPYLEDGTPVDIIISPLSVLARMNLGQLLEAHLGWAAEKLGYKVAVPVFEEVSEDKITSEMTKAGLPVSGKVRLYDGKTGESYSEDSVVGVGYILKLIHMVDDKMHARSTGPYSLVTQQPLGGKAQMGGQRLGEMEVWALEAHKAAYTLQEMLTIKSDDVFGRTKAFEAIVTDQVIPASSIPESFKVLMRELNSLGLDVVMMEPEIVETKEDVGTKENLTDASGQTVVADDPSMISDAPSEDAGGVVTGEEDNFEQAQEVEDDREPSAEDLAEEV